MSKAEVTCADCGVLFNTGWTDEEASAEFAQNFKGSNIRTAAVVCDNCYKNYVAPEVEE